MTFLIIAAGILVGIIFCFVISGITINDIRSIRLEKNMQKRPNARHWRRRPTVTLHTKDDVLFRVLRKNYRKLAPATETSNPPNGLVLNVVNIPASARLDVLYAVQQLNTHPHIHSIELLPIFNQLPQTTTQLFSMYRVLIGAPFANARNGFGITTNHSPFPVLINSSPVAHRARNSMYAAGRRIAHLAHLFVFAYAVYLAVFLTQPESLLLYLGCFALWSVVAIGSYQHLSFRQKLTLVILLPVSGVYFVYRLIVAPLRFTWRPQPKMV